MKKKIYSSLFFIAVSFLVAPYGTFGQRSLSKTSIAPSVKKDAVGIGPSYRGGAGNNHVQNLFDIQFNYNLSTSTSSAALAGVVFTGTEFWVTQWSRDSIYTLSPSGNVTARFTIAGVGTPTSGIRALTYDGTFIYACENTKIIKKINPVTKTLVSSITSQTSFNVRGMSWDSTANGGAGGFWVSNFGTDIVLISMSGSVLNTIPAATHGLTGVYGLAFDPYSSNGPYIWAFDQGITSGAFVVRIPVATGVPDLTHDVNTDVGSGTGLAGGLAITNLYAPPAKSIIGVLQGDLNLFGYELTDYTTPAIDASADSIFFSPPYTQIPHFEVSPFNWTVKARSLGTNSINDLVTTFTLNDGTTDVFAPPASHSVNVAQGTSVSNSFGPYAPAKGAYTAQAVVSTGSQTDEDTSNDTVQYNLYVTNGVMARDDGRPTNSLGIGDGTGGTLGQIFELTKPALVTSITFLCQQPTLGDSTSAVVYSFSPGVGPTTLLYKTTSHIFSSADSGNGALLTLPIIGGPQTLAPGTYFIGVNEHNNNVTLATSNFNFQPGAAWVIFGGFPWTPVEDYGFNITFLLRLNLLDHYNTIKGSCFLDVNKNGVRDGGEQGFTNVSVVSQGNSGSFSTIPSSTGDFMNYSPDTGMITTTLQNLKYHSFSPPQHTSSFSSYFNVDSVDFALVPTGGIQDLRISMFSYSTPRPGFNSSYRIVYSNVGTDTVSNNIYLIKDTRVSIISSVPNYDGINGDSIQWAYSNLLPNETRSIDVTLRVSPPPTVNFGDYLTSRCVIEPVATDTVPADNYACVCEELVRGSYDPNDKTMLGGGFTTLQVAGGEYLTYLIRFQNTGSDTAFNIVVIDELDNDLVGSSFEMVSASHAYTVSIENNSLVNWTFTNILLPDSNTNEPASHGYICYRVKPKSTLIAGDVIKNTANIFFDFNLPVATNTVVTTVEFPVAVASIGKASENIVLFPNPTKGNLTLALSLKKTASVKIVFNNSLGEIVATRDFNSMTLGGHEVVFDTRKFPSGIYFVNVSVDGNVQVKKMVKME